MLAHVDDLPAVPSTVVPGLPASVDALLGRALEKDPAKRFQTASAMTDALARAAGELGLDTSRFEELSRSAETAVKALQESWGTDPPASDYLEPEPQAIDPDVIAAMLHAPPGAKRPPPAAPLVVPSPEKAQAQQGVLGTGVVEVLEGPRTRSHWRRWLIGALALAAVAVACFILR